MSEYFVASYNFSGGPATGTGLQEVKCPTGREEAVSGGQESQSSHQVSDHYQLMGSHRSLIFHDHHLVFLPLRNSHLCLRVFGIWCFCRCTLWRKLPPDLGNHYQLMDSDSRLIFQDHIFVFAPQLRHHCKMIQNLLLKMWFFKETSLATTTNSVCGRGRGFLIIQNKHLMNYPYIYICIFSCSCIFIICIFDVFVGGGSTSAMILNKQLMNYPEQTLIFANMHLIW